MRLRRARMALLLEDHLPFKRISHCEVFKLLGLLARWSGLSD